MVEWIEISKDTFFKKLPDVSTLVVEWIEILAGMTQQQVAESPPSWWSGLKSNSYWYVPFPQVVSTLVVEWIEINRSGLKNLETGSPPSWWSGLK